MSCRFDDTNNDEKQTMTVTFLAQTVMTGLNRDIRTLRRGLVPSMLPCGGVWRMRQASVAITT